MSPKHGPWRAEVDFGKISEQRIDRFDLAELIAADRAVVAIQTNPQIGSLKAAGSPLREYREPGTDVRVVYSVNELGNRATILYIQV
ncbi:hypothetical protein ACWGCW_19035 [Streptomyces sp. NPDC054933]